MKAFSLVEILVVLAVISILLVVCIPLYRHAADFQMDVMPEALRCTRALAMQGTYAAMLIRQDSLGNWSICMGIQRIAVMPTSGILYEALIDLDTKRIQVPDEYESALVVYDSSGQLINGFDILVDGQAYTSTNQLVFDGKTKWLHRYMGGFAKQ